MGDSESDATERGESTERTESRVDTNRRRVNADRRSVLRALGGAGALAAFTGGGAAHEGEADERAASLADATDARSPAEARERARQQGAIDPVWGFPALSEDADPPTSPDAEVRLQIRPREAPIPEFVFEPTGLYVEPGDTVRFTYESPHHTVTAYHPAFGYLQRVPDGVPPFSAPVLPQGGYWLYTFDRPGVYDLHCAPHEIFGHAMRVVVGSPSGPGADPLPDLCAGQGTTIRQETAEQETATTAETATTTPEDDGDESQQDGGAPEPEPPRLTAYTVLSDPALDPANVVDEGRVSWDSLAPESKQLFVQIRGFPPC